LLRATVLQYLDHFRRCQSNGTHARVLELLSIILLGLHLVAMNVASAAPLFCIGLQWQAQAASEIRRRLFLRLAWSAVLALFVGMITGGGLLLFVPDDGLSLALRRFPAEAYWFAAAELLFSLVCLLALAVGRRYLGKWWLALLAVAAATNLLYHFPPLMAVIGRIAAYAQWSSEPLITRPILLHLMARGEVLALTFHFGLSSFAVSAILLLYYLSHIHSNDAPGEWQSIARRSAVIALAATLLQIPIGIWLLANLTDSARSALLGGAVASSLAFVIALLLSIMLLQRLVAVALGETDGKNLRWVGVLLCGVILMMTVTLRASRFGVEVPDAATTKAPR
jgi:hypothetical protein